MPWAHQYENGTCTLCGELQIPSIEQAEKLTVSALIQNGDQPLKITFAREFMIDEDGTPCGSHFYVCTEEDGEKTEYLYQVTEDTLVQYLCKGDDLIRNSAVHSDATAKIYEEQFALFQTLLEPRKVLEPAADATPDPLPVLPLTSITIGDGDALEITEENILYYSLGDGSGYAGIHRDTNALVLLVDADGRCLISVTELSLNHTLQKLEKWVEKADSAPLLVPDVAFHEELDAFRVNCLIFEQDSVNEEAVGSPLTLTMLRNDEDLIVYAIETLQNGEPVRRIYEIASDGNVTGYQVQGEAGEPQPITAPDLKDELKQQLELAYLFTDYTSLLSGCQYGYANPELFSLDDSAVVYQVLDQTKCKGYIALDTATGILKGLYDEECRPLLVVQELETENVTLDITP